MKRIATPLIALAALLAAVPASASQAAPAAGQRPRLAVSFFTAGLLAEVVARVEAERIEQERLAEAYLQETTGLIWARDDNGLDLDWYDAGEYCEQLQIADWTDWRLPTIDELESLHDRRSEAVYKLPRAFRLTGCCPWSVDRNGQSSAWNFSFRYRKRFSGSLNYSFELRALCVRQATEEDVRFYELAAEEAKAKAKARS